MDVVIRLQVFILAFLMLLIIYVQLIIEGTSYFLQHRLFKFYVLSTMFLILFEAMSWILDGRPGQAARIIATTVNAIIIACSMVPLMVYTLYMDFQIYNSTKRIKRNLIPIIAIWLINTFFAVTAPINNLYFYMDANNYYHRGSWVKIAVSIYVVLFVYDIFLVLVNWKRINRKNKVGMLLPLFLPFLCFFLQMRFYGLSLSWMGVSLSILIVYITNQSQTIKIDYLTGLYNRRQLDYYLKSKINSLSKNQKFAGIMIDVDHFKRINDEHGHIIGDRAIEVTGSILKRFFHNNDFIARYAGDEFVILFEMRENEHIEEKVVNLQRQFISFNEKNEEPFKLQISIGYAVYEYGSGQNSDSFLKQLDNLMYENKYSKRNLVFLGDYK